MQIVLTALITFFASTLVVAVSHQISGVTALFRWSVYAMLASAVVVFVGAIALVWTT